MRRGLSCLALLVAAVTPATAQPPALPVKQLLIRPAAPPIPALKFVLLPDLQDQTPGNAALLYQRAHSPEWFGQHRRQADYDKMHEWLQVPLKDLPRQKIVLPTQALREVDKAARREQCDWEMTPRMRSEGIGVLLPDVQSFREYGDLLALRARLEIADGHFDKAVYTMQTGMALSRHVGEAPILINGLVAIAIAKMMLGQLEELIQTPGSPNMYWALTALPRPFVDLRKALQGERLMLLASVPDLKDIETAQLTPQQQQALLDRMANTLRGLIDNPQQVNLGTKLGLITLVMKTYPEARRLLIVQGRKPQEVEALPAIQVVMIYSVYQYRRLQDDLYKWSNLPYWEARPGLRAVEKQIQQSRQNMEEGIPFASLLLPALEKVYFATVRLDRQIAALRCVEAIRLYAAAHEGKLPAALSDIKEVPLPLDPVTGKPFEYQLADDTATLSAPPPSGDPAGQHNTLTYLLKLAR